ncbi:6662_t:CDS:2, partial [Scutellospora calospora]
MDEKSLSSFVNPDSQDKAFDVTEPTVDLQPECLEHLKKTDPSHISDDSCLFNDDSRSDSKHPLPNNDKEADRLQVVHYLLKSLFQSNYIAPVHSILKDSNAKVLDVCCGSAIWILEMAAEFPLSTFTGINITTICPRDIPSNCNFIQANILDGLPFPDDYFDYVHCRCALAGFNVNNVNDWNNKIIPEIVRVSKPAAFFEHCEFDVHNVNAGPILKKISNAELSFGSSRGVDGMVFDKIGDFLLSNKFLTNINQQKKYCPLGTWGGESGKMVLVQSQMAEFMNLTSQEFEDMINDCIKEAESFRTYSKIHIICAQKIVPSITV